MSDKVKCALCPWTFLVGNHTPEDVAEVAIHHVAMYHAGDPLLSESGVITLVPADVEIRRQP